MDFKLVINWLACFVLLSCVTKPKIENSGIVRLKTMFYDSSGVSSYTFFIKVWYEDSLTIQQIDRANFVTINSKITVTYSPILFRFTDLSKKVFYDYKHFSDTAIPFNKGILPDSLMKDYGWTYYSDKIVKIEGTPQYLSDTIIEGINYKKMRFNFIGDNPQKVYKIGYMRCDGKGMLFSLEKSYSKKLNCAMTRFDDFEFGKKTPNVIMEIEFLSDTLKKEEKKVFEAWERNIKIIIAKE